MVADLPFRWTFLPIRTAKVPAGLSSPWKPFPYWKAFPAESAGGLQSPPANYSGLFSLPLKNSYPKYPAAARYISGFRHNRQIQKRHLHLTVQASPDIQELPCARFSWK